MIFSLVNLRLKTKLQGGLFDGPGTNGRRYRGGGRYGGGKAGPACGVLFVVVMGGDWGHFGGAECVA